ncbi:hypothetical protein Moror_7221 [Moniliophthora roreri MCA 2997]|uniref:Uncharacterized protein n=1 Tax=Moniliophthora roreri (strain MCA 2997) TaxID=1381753 RepID=V2XTQ8_MONRO|nr:hypothetical protein Moror_7221 [Moniliophthora roreri MCA 2997]
MSALTSAFAIHSTENTRKRKRNVTSEDDASDIYDSNGKTRRVNPKKLGERLGPDLVREMEAYIEPGAAMPNFAIRKELQERYQVDRRHLYDYFHSRGLRVAKEDRHSNLTRSRQAKAAAAAGASASSKDALVSVKMFQKPTKVSRPVFTPVFINTPTSTKVEESCLQQSLNDHHIPTTIVSPPAPSPKSHTSSPEPELCYPPSPKSSPKPHTPNTEPELCYPSSPEPLPSNPNFAGDSLHTDVVSGSGHVSKHLSAQLPFDCGLPPEQSSNATSVESPDEGTLPHPCNQVPEIFCPVAFVQETVDFDYTEWLNLDNDESDSAGILSNSEITSSKPIISLGTDMSPSERQIFYGLVKDALDPVVQEAQVYNGMLKRPLQSPSAPYLDSHTNVHVSTAKSSMYPECPYLASQAVSSPMPMPLPRSSSRWNCHSLHLTRYAHDYSKEATCLGDRPFPIPSSTQQQSYRSSRFRATSAGGGI